MALILAIETSTAACSVALLDCGAIDELFVVAPQQHTQRLLPMVDQLLKKHQKKLQDLDAIAYSSGPGSFTGLRICLGMVQGLAFGAGLPLVKVSSLALLAFGICQQEGLPQETLLVPALDAHMSEVYWAVYRYQQDAVTPLVADSVGRLQDIPVANWLDTKQLDTKENEIVVAVGDGWQGQSGSMGMGFHHIYPDFYPRATHLAQLGAKQFSLGQVESVFESSPSYVRKETTWKKRQKIRP